MKVSVNFELKHPRLQRPSRRISIVIDILEVRGRVSRGIFRTRRLKYRPKGGQLGTGRYRSWSVRDPQLSQQKNDIPVLAPTCAPMELLEEPVKETFHGLTIGTLRL